MKKTKMNFLIIALYVILFGNIGKAQDYLCEGFNSTTFPPTGWTLVSLGGSWWFRQPYSGFGLGVGSLMLNFWNAPLGDIGTLTTRTFYPASTGDSLKFDIAYCPLGTSPDSLIILTSTDGGSTFTILVNLGYLEMQTFTGCPHPWVPNSSSWDRRGYVVPSGTNKIRFHGISGFGDDLYLDSICVGHLVGITNNGKGVPKEYSLSQNYPNPFNPTTVISYQVPMSSAVKLTVYDVMGRLIKTLVNEKQYAGTYHYEIDGSNYSSGVYFYKLNAGDFTETKKMILIK